MALGVLWRCIEGAFLLVTGATIAFFLTWAILGDPGRAARLVIAGSLPMAVLYPFAFRRYWRSARSHGASRANESESMLFIGAIVALVLGLAGVLVSWWASSLGGLAASMAAVSCSTALLLFALDVVTEGHTRK